MLPVCLYSHSSVSMSFLFVVSVFIVEVSGSLFNQTPRGIIEEYSKTKGMDDKAQVLLDLFDSKPSLHSTIPISFPTPTVSEFNRIQRQRTSHSTGNRQESAVVSIVLLNCWLFQKEQERRREQALGTPNEQQIAISLLLRCV